MASDRASGEGTAALEKAIDVLEAIGDSGRRHRPPRLSDKVGLPKTTVYRILTTLVARGLVWRDPLRRVYCLGARTIELARKAYTMPELVAAARAELTAMRDLTGETTYLATLDGTETVSLERCDGAHNVRSASALGVRKALYCTSQGKAMLAALDEETRNGIVAQLELHPLTRKTITDRRKLKAELKLTAERGYAIDEEEIVMGVRCVGARDPGREGTRARRHERRGPRLSDDAKARRAARARGRRSRAAHRRAARHRRHAGGHRALERDRGDARGAMARFRAGRRAHDALFWADKVGREVQRLDAGAGTSHRRAVDVAGHRRSCCTREGSSSRTTRLAPPRRRGQDARRVRLAGPRAARAVRAPGRRALGGDAPRQGLPRGHARARRRRARQVAGRRAAQSRWRGTAAARRLYGVAPESGSIL